MTTVTYRDGVMAADTQGTNSHMHAADRRKVFSIHGWLLGGCGNSSHLDEFYDWFRANCKDGKLREPPKCLKVAANSHGGWTVMAVNIKDGVVYQFADGLYPFKMEGKFFACGSGMGIALGAMAMGASAEKAVEVAMRFDIYTGGKINKVKVK